MTNTPAMKLQRFTSTKRHQRGLGTLLTAVVLLVVSMIFLTAISRSIVMEQRMAANEIRAKQAFEAAEDGLDRAMVHLLGNGSVETTLTGTSGAGRYSVAFCNPVDPPVEGTQVCPDTAGGTPACNALTSAGLNPNGTSEQIYFNSPLVVACGWSDDGLGKRGIRQSVGTAGGGTTQLPTNPLLTKGAVNVGGSANVVNYFNNLTIWSGQSLTSVGNSGKTFVRNPNVAPPAANTTPPGEPSSCTTSADYVCVTDKNTTGPDVIDNDPTLANLSNSELFRNIFGTTMADYQANLAQIDIPSASASSLENVVGKAIMVTGNTTLPNGTIGSRNRPVKLVINGDLNLQGGPTVFGLVYVTGQVSGGGNLRVNGVMVTEQAVSPTGSIDIIYDPFITNLVETNTGRAGWIPGSWRDWR